MFISIFIAIIICLVSLYFKLKTHNYWKKRNVVQVGDVMLKFMLGKISMPEICKKIYDEHDTGLIGTTMGLKPAVILKNLEDLQAVVAGDFQSFHSRSFVSNPNDILTRNLVFTNNFQEWKLLRQKLTPTFTSSKLKNMFYIIEKCARDFVDFVEDNPNLRQKPFNLLYTYTTASIGSAVFGIDTRTNNSMDSPFLNMAWKSLETSTYQNIVLFTGHVFPKLFHLLKLKFFGQHEDFFVGTVKTVLESRRRSPQKTHDFINICLELQNQGTMQDSSTGFKLEPTDELLAAQAFFFFIAGADTTATALHFTLLELSNNPQILFKVHKEIDELFENNNEELNYSDMEKLQYLDMVINEAMRKYPAIGVVERLCTKDTVLPSGVPIGKGTVVMIPIYAIHRDEKYYPDPDVFDPERFAPENISNITKYAYLPFGEGNRICIGYRFARFQMKTALAWLLRKFTLIEQKCVVPKFEHNPFGLKSTTTKYELKLRK